MKVTHDNINTFLYTPGKYFVIPDFQRPYSWDKANIISFIEDLESVMLGDKKHYFGSIVYINEGNNSTIIDGQQRATTVLLMLTVLYHIASDKPESSSISAEEIKEKYLYNRHSYSENANRIKLKTVTTDNEIFEHIFSRTELDENGKNSRLFQAYLLFYEYFKERTNLKKYVDVLENFEVVTIALDASDDNPQRIFESINSTGKPLTDGDKIRNFALMLNDHQAREVVLKKYWEKIETQLNVVNKDYISDFFKFYLTSQLQKEIKIEHVYPEFKKLFYTYIGAHQDDVAKLEAFYSVVLSYLNHYLYLKFNKKNNDSYKIVEDNGFRLNFLKIESPYPFLMSALDRYSQGKLEGKELQKVFQIVEGYLARRIVCNIPTTGSNSLFSSLHKDIEGFLTEYPEQSYSSVLGYIMKNKSGGLRLPKQTEIESAVKNNPIYSQRNYYINFILSSIDDQSKESTLLKQIAKDEIELSIEHIMPQTLSPQWIDELGPNSDQIYQQYVDTLPNLTLTGYNSKYSNRDFVSKKQIKNGFNESPLLINQFIKQFDKWNLISLEKREKWWVEQIENIWPTPSTSFEPKRDETEFTFFDDKDLAGSRVKAVIILGETIECETWILVLENIIKRLFALEDNLYDQISTDDYLCRYIKADKDALRVPSQIEGTPYFYEKNTGTHTKQQMVIRLTEILGLDKTDIKVVLANAE